MRSKKLFLGKERNSVCRTEIHTTGQATNPNSKAQGSLMMDSPKNIKHFTAQKCAQLICDNTVPALAEEGNKHWHQQLLSQNSTRTKILTSKEPIRWNITDYWQTQKWQRTAGPKTILTTDHFFFCNPFCLHVFPSSWTLNTHHSLGSYRFGRPNSWTVQGPLKKIIKKPTKQRKACFNNTGVGLKTARPGQRSWVRERARETNVYRSDMAEMPEGKRHRYCQNTLPEYCNLKL